MHFNGCNEWRALAFTKPRNRSEVLYEHFGHILTGEIPRRYGKLADLVSYDLGFSSSL